MSLKHIETRIAPRAPALTADAPAIPRVIHQTFETTEIAERMHEAAMSWVEMNPDHEYRFHTDADRRAFIAEEFGADVMAAYERLDNGAFRADLWRYCQLYRSGGVYADIDSVCRMPLSELLTGQDAFVAARSDNVPHALSNGFICVVPEHPFLLAVIERATTAILNARGDIDGYRVTGPWGLGVAINTALHRRQKHAFEVGATETAFGTLRLLEKTGTGSEGAGALSHDGRTVLLTEYPGYATDLEATGVRHWRREGRYAKESYPRLRRVVRRLRQKYPGWF